MGTPSISWHYPLAESFLCVNCHQVGGSMIRCPSCACETGILSLEAVLGRSEAPGEATSQSEATDSLETAQAGGNDATEVNPVQHPSA